MLDAEFVDYLCNNLHKVTKDYADHTNSSESTTISQTEAKREAVRLKSARARCIKKTRVLVMEKEHHRLELKLKKLIATIEDRHNTSHRPLPGALEQLALERVILASENTEILVKIKNYTKFQHSIITTSGVFSWYSPTRKVGPACAVSRLDEDDREWCVVFPNGEPSFYFYPFTRVEFNAALKCFDDSLSSLPSNYRTSGTLLGWTVHHSPLWRRQDGKVVARSTFTTRVNCGLDYADAVVTKSSPDSRPLLLTPPNWSYKQRPYVTTLPLQRFDEDSSVMVCSVPGDMHLRFYLLAQRRELADEESGARSVQFRAVMADSEANARNRAAESSTSRIHWAFEGGHSLKLTDVKQETIDIEYHHWAVCENELHARHLYVQWARYVTTFGCVIGAATNLIKSR